MPRIVVLGANAAARIVAYNLSYDSSAEIVGFTDPDSSKWGMTLLGKPILGSDEALPKLLSEGVTHAIIAAGDPHLRCRLRELVTGFGFELANAIHPSAVISPGVMLGKGVVVLAGSVLSDNPIVEDNVWVGLAATITHDTRIGRDSLIGGRSAVGAEVDVGERAVVGWGCIVGPRRRIGCDASVGFGSNVVRDIPERAIAVGNPAQVIKYRD
jgi:sugar O-acyltransferase (sialic acid O-acetyltransferase NeuD family)